MSMTKRILGVLLSGVLITVMAAPAFATSLQDAKKEKSGIESNIKEVEQQIKDMKVTKGNLEDYIKKLDSSLNQIVDDLGSLEEQLTEKEQQIADTQEALELAKEQEADQYEAMKLRILYMYENSTGSQLSMLLEAGSISELLKRVEYMSAMSEYDRKMLVKFQETKEYIEETEEKLTQEKTELEDMKSEAEDRKSSVESAIKKKNDEIERYENDIADAEQLKEEYEQELAQMTQVMKRLEEEEKKRQQELSNSGQTGQTYDNGQFAWPCPASTRITSDYGTRYHPTLGYEKFHNGIDIGAPTGSSILAAYDGEVVSAAYDSVMGNYVMINHGSGLYTIYMHASALYVSSGQKVSRGEQIAAVGSTGRSTGPHLHFTVRLNGSYVSPWNYVS